MENHYLTNNYRQILVNTINRRNKYSGKYKKDSISIEKPLDRPKIIASHLFVNLQFTICTMKNQKKQVGLVGRLPKQN